MKTKTYLIKTYLIIVVAFLLSMSALSQNDSLRKQIMNYERVSYEFLHNGRRMLQECIEKDDFVKAKEVKDLLLSDNNGNVYNTFYPNEYIFILYWTNEYSELLDFIMHVNYLHPMANSVMDIAAEDELFYTLKDKSVANKHILIDNIESGNISEMDKDFLVLHLEDMLRSDLDSRDIHIDAPHTEYVNNLADDFLEKYPDSPYEFTIRESIRYKFEPAPFTYHLDFLGFGAVVPGGNLGGNINGGVAMEMALDLRFKRFVTIIGGGLSAHSVKYNVSYNGGRWYEGSDVGHSVFYLNVGALLADDESISFYPFAGFGYGGFTSQDNYSNPSSWFPQLGVGVDFKLKRSHFNPYYGSNSSSRISVRYAYRMHDYGTESSDLEGGSHTITISWGIGKTTRKRVW